MAHCLRKLYHRYEWCEYFQLKIQFSDSYQLFDAATESEDQTPQKYKLSYQDGIIHLRRISSYMRYFHVILVCVINYRNTH